MQGIGQESHEDVRLDPVLQLMIDRPQAQIILKAFVYGDLVIIGITSDEYAKKMGKYEQITEGKSVEEWMKGIVRGATEAKCIVPSGEIGDVSDILRGVTEGRGFDMVVAAIGEVTKEKMISGRNNLLFICCRI
jgi:phosphoribosylaminoimidazole (AIR) synthetase